MWCIVGLGNPGSSYARHRHNIGFMALDALAEHYRADNFTAKFHGHVARARIGGEDCLLLKPDTFMNLSGKSVQAACAFYKIAPENLIVLHDELALPLAKLRIKRGGGHNGHNGLRDIDKALGTEYWRIRLGIEHPGDKDRVHGHVLSDFSAEEKPLVEDFLKKLTTHFEQFFTHSPEALMSKMADAPKPEKKADKAPVAE